MKMWSEIVASMPEPVRAAFLKWWTEHPPFSFELDMQALVAEAWLEASSIPPEPSEAS